MRRVTAVVFLSMLLCLMGTISVHAETANVLLNKYGYSVTNTVEVEASKLLELESERDAVLSDINYKQMILDSSQKSITKFQEMLTDIDASLYVKEMELGGLQDLLTDVEGMSADDILARESLYSVILDEITDLQEQRRLLVVQSVYLASMPTISEEDNNKLYSCNLSVEQQKAIVTRAKKYNDLGDITNWKHPLDSELRITSNFGYRLNPVTLQGIKFHYGLDMAARTGTKVLAAFNGSVELVGYDNSRGNYVVINHGNGIKTVYYHMYKVLCSKGKSLTQYEVIGLSGNTGSSTGPHLHFGVYINGKAVDPAILL